MGNSVRLFVDATVRFHLRVFNVEPEIDSTFRVEIFNLNNYQHAHYLI
jgi:hypothetical protein